MKIHLFPPSGRVVGIVALSPRYLGREAELRGEFADAWLQAKNSACA